jgi:hypothetical protein
MMEETSLTYAGIFDFPSKGAVTTIKGFLTLRPKHQIVAITMKTFQIISFFALIAASMAFAPNQVSQGEFG